MRTAAVAEIKSDATAALASLDRIIGAAAKLDAIRSAMAEVMAPIVSSAKAMVQQPGKPGYSPRHGKAPGSRRYRKHLRDTISTNVRVYNKVVYGAAGPQYPAGAGGHLVEHGHRIVTGGSVARIGKYATKKTPKAARGRTGKGRVGGMAKPFPFMRPAMESTRASVLSRLTAVLAAHVERAAAAGGG